LYTVEHIGYFLQGCMGHIFQGGGSINSIYVRRSVWICSL